MELVKFQEKLNLIHDIAKRGATYSDINYYQSQVFDGILDCLEELSMEISKINNDKFPI